jgi:hypothetical protein
MDDDAGSRAEWHHFPDYNDRKRTFLAKGEIS